MERYARLVAALDARPVRLALYHPLLAGWREWAFDPAATPAVDAESAGGAATAVAPPSARPAPTTTAKSARIQGFVSDEGNQCGSFAGCRPRRTARSR